MPWLTNCELGLFNVQSLRHDAQETAHAMDANPDSEIDWLHGQLLELRNSTAELLTSAAIQANDHPSAQTNHDYQVLRAQLRRANRSLWRFEHSVPSSTSQPSFTLPPSP